MDFTLEELNDEFEHACKEIVFLTVRLGVGTRIRIIIMEWIKKLYNMSSTDTKESQTRYEYAQYLRIAFLSDPVLLYPPFDTYPSFVHDLPPLSEELGNNMALQCPLLSRFGPIQPVLYHKSEDGNAFMTIKKCPEGGLFCYVAVTPTKPNSNNDT